MSILGWTEDWLQDRGALCTAQEIGQQPRVWRQAIASMAADAQGLKGFMRQQLATPGLRVILTGAGTSAFVGQCLAPAISAAHGLRVEALSTTDLVSGPGLLLQQHVPTLLVSFARSGSSPESVEAVRLADQLVNDCRHLVVTCNGDGELAGLLAGRDATKNQVLVLPPETHDRGFAMTSSFSTMLLSAAYLFGLITDVEALAAACLDLQQASPRIAQGLAGKFDRVVFLGSNELKAVARESALKLLELSDGQVIGYHESPLGFRHGPKTIINGKTLVVAYVSNDATTARYDWDLVRELRADGRAAKVITLSSRELDGLGNGDDVLVRGAAGLSDLEQALVFVSFAQIFAVQQSLSLGITPDNPSASGTVNRVVKGVVIHQRASVQA